MIGKHRGSGILHAGLAASVAAAALLSAHTAAQAEVGVAAAVNVDARGRPPGGAPRVISLGQNVVFNEEISTDGRGLVQVLLLDGTTFTVGPNSQLRIDEFVYDPNTGDARVIASVTKGAFRFIGGQTSRKPGGATINTPVGTIGIRGAMVEGDVGGGAAKFSMIFGDEVLFTGRNGASSRIYQPGYTMEVGGGGQTNVRRRTKEDAQTFQTALAGSGDQSGGASEQPTDASVSSSPVTAVNSNLPNQGPIPEARPAAVQATGIDEVEERVAQIENVTQDDVRQDVIEEEEPSPEPEPEPETTQARVLTAPEEYDPYDSDDTIPNAGSRGLVGSTPESDQQIELVHSNGRLVSEDAGIDLPDITGSQGDTGLQRVNVTDGLSSDGPVSGFAYAGEGDFAAYLLGINGDPTRPFRLIHGTPADFTAISAAGGNHVRHYSLTTDPIRGTPAPFFAPDLYGPMSNFGSTDYLIVEPGAAEDERWRTFLSWVSIEGDGAEQKSATGLNASSIFRNEEDDHAIGGSRRGSFRSGGQSGPVVMRGGIGTVGNGDGDHFFGGNLENFVIGSGVTPSDAFYDDLLGPGFSFDPNDGYLGDGIFGTQHVADLQTEVPMETLSRTSRVRSGYMAGNAESTTLPIGSFTMLSSGETPNLHLELDAQENRMFAAADLRDYFDFRGGIDGLQLSFGAGNGGSGGNTFVDDNVFGATQNNNRENTRFLTDGGQSVAHAANSNPGSYIVSGRANPIAGYQHCAGCDFIDWGWWGTQAIFEGNGTAELPEWRAEYVHMGTWVAGDITASADLPTNISATFEGTALGNVYSHETHSQYIVLGGVVMSYDFGSRSGTININDYDGLDFVGMIGGGDDDQALFAGSLTGPGVDTGAIAGSFVDDGDGRAAGIMGNFLIEGTVIDSVGTIVGERTGTGAPLTTVNARVLTSPDVFQTPDPTPYPAVGGRGLVGSTPETDRNLAFADFGGVLIAGGEIWLPDLTGIEGDGGLEAIAVDNAQYEALPAGGIAYAGRGDFVTYLLGIQGDPTQPLYVIAGTPTPDAVLAGLNAGPANIREYTLTTDPIRPSPLPFFANDLYGGVANYNSSNLFIIESDTAQFHGPGETIYDAKVLQSWVTIDGEGVNQKSAALVYASDIYQSEDGSYEISGVRRGSFRHGSHEGPANMRSSLGSIDGASGDALFGPDMEHFVLGSPPEESDGFSDSLFGPGYTGNEEDGYLGGGYPFSTHHVADLVGTTPQASLSRTHRTGSLGFMTGMMESTGEGRNNPYLVGSDIGPNFVLQTDPTFNIVTAAAVLQDVYDPLSYGPSQFDGSSIADSYLVTFGVANELGGGSAFVDDDTFGATRSSDRELTRLRTDGGQDLAHISGESAGSYMVSGKANPIAGFGHCTDCSFLDWGWWGTRVRVEGDGVEISDARRTDYLHMGTWVAGDISNPADLPTNITASYSGTAVGNVARQTTDGVAKYIAQGGMKMSFDFNSRTGNMKISDFDGMNLISELSDRSTTSHALFGGQLAGSGVSGNVTGAFVNNGPNVAAGVIGNFGVAGSGVTATGTIAGVKD